MKRIVFALLISLISTLGYAQSVDVGSIEDGTLDLAAGKIRNKLNKDGIFIIVDSNDFLKLLMREDGTVNWYLDGSDLFIRDGFFEAFPGDTTQYDFLYIDGEKGRIGFNVLSDTSRFDELPLTSSIHLYGSIAYRVRRLDLDDIQQANYQVQQDDYIIILEEPSADREMTLPRASSCKGRQYIFKRTDSGSNKISIKTQEGDFIDGTKTIVALNQGGDGGTFVSDGLGWWQVSEEAKLDATYTPITITDTTLTVEDLVEIDFTSGSGQTLTINLPNVLQFKGSEYVIKRNDTGNTGQSNNLIVKPGTGQSLDNFTNSTPYIMGNDWESVTVRSNGSQWLIINAYNH